MKNISPKKLNKLMHKLESNVAYDLKKRFDTFFLDTGLTVSELNVTFNSGMYMNTEYYFLHEVEVTAT
jgi:hypothetical protein